MIIGLLHGPNLNELGKRAIDTYGTFTLTDIIDHLTRICEKTHHRCIHFQSHHEGDLIRTLWDWKAQNIDGVIINPGAYAHTSIALRDAISGTQLPTIEVHISNLYAREAFRHTSLTGSVCKGVITGLGLFGYEAALQCFLHSKPSP